MTLDELCREFAEITEEGFAIRLDRAQKEWNAAIRAAGRKEAYRRMAEWLCRTYRERFGREYLFTEKCVAFEIQFHADAYFSVTVGGYPRHIGTLPFSGEALISHCRVIDISTEDVKSLKQRLMFGYRRGIRRCWRGTPRDPFRRMRENEKA